RQRVRLPRVVVHLELEPVLDTLDLHALRDALRQRAERPLDRNLVVIDRHLDFLGENDREIAYPGHGLFLRPRSRALRRPRLSPAPCGRSSRLWTWRRS